MLIGLIESGQWARIAEVPARLPAFYERFATDAGIPLGRFGRAAEFADLGCLPAVGAGLVRDGTAINLDGGLSPAV